MKIDIKKAFDSLDWDFLYVVLHSFGFLGTFISWIQNILHSARILILTPAGTRGYF